MSLKELFFCKLLIRLYQCKYIDDYHANFEKISSGTEAGGDHEGQGDIVSEETETMHEPHEEGGELEILEDDRHAAHEPRQVTGQVMKGKTFQRQLTSFRGRVKNSTMQ